MHPSSSPVGTEWCRGGWVSCSRLCSDGAPDERFPAIVICSLTTQVRFRLRSSFCGSLGELGLPSNHETIPPSFGVVLEQLSKLHLSSRTRSSACPPKYRHRYWNNQPFTDQDTPLGPTSRPQSQSFWCCATTFGATRRKAKARWALSTAFLRFVFSAWPGLLRSQAVVRGLDLLGCT